MAITTSSTKVRRVRKGTSTKKRDITTRATPPKDIMKFTNLMNSKKINTSLMKREIQATKRNTEVSTRNMATRRVATSTKVIIMEATTRKNTVKKVSMKKAVTTMSTKDTKRPVDTIRTIITIMTTARKATTSTIGNMDTKKVTELNCWLSEEQSLTDDASNYGLIYFLVIYMAAIHSVKDYVATYK